MDSQFSSIEVSSVGESFDSEGIRVNTNRTKGQGRPLSASDFSKNLFMRMNNNPDQQIHARRHASFDSVDRDGVRAPLLKQTVSSYDTMLIEAGNQKSSKSSLASSLTDLLNFLKFWPMDKTRAFHIGKVLFLITITIVCCGSIMLAEEVLDETHLKILPPNENQLLAEDTCHKARPYLRLTIRGPFNTEEDGVDTTNSTVILLKGHPVMNLTVNGTALAHDEITETRKDIKCDDFDQADLTSVSDVQLAIEWSVLHLTEEVSNEVVLAFLVLGFVYVLIIFELVHRTLAAFLGALAALAVLSQLNERPSLEHIIEWIDMETLTLLFGMMIIVAIFSETGFFDYSALQAYKLAKGKVWPLITLLCVFSAVVSAFLDNVTTILLMAPVTIRLCEVLNLDPRRILIAEVLFSNIGGTATAIGDPPNVIIVGALSSRGVDFSTFTGHMFPGIIIISFVGYGVLRLYYRNIDSLKNKDPPHITEMKHEVAMWRLTAQRMTVITREETLMRALFLQKAVETEHALNKTIHKMRKEERTSMQETIEKLERQYYIKDGPLLVKCGLILTVVIIFLFIYSFVDSLYLDIGWIAVLGAILLLVLADVNDMEGVLHKVEWTTLLFFAALFVLMEALAELGLIKTIGDTIANIITSVDKDDQMLVALIIILWASALASSFIDNIPYTTAMVPVLKQLADDPNVNVDLLPMVIALAMGACLGGNGTLIGASCNVVCAGIAEQHGYSFSFKEFFKIGFPMMLVTTSVAMGYVLLCHSAIGWNS